MSGLNVVESAQSEESKGLRIGVTRSFPTNTCMIISNYTRFLLPPLGLRLWTPMEEDDWKAVLGKTERTVW